MTTCNKNKLVASTQARAQHHISSSLIKTLNQKNHHQALRLSRHPGPFRLEQGRTFRKASSLADHYWNVLFQPTELWIVLVSCHIWPFSHLNHKRSRVIYHLQNTTILYKSFPLTYAPLAWPFTHFKTQGNLAKSERSSRIRTFLSAGVLGSHPSQNLAVALCAATEQEQINTPCGTGHLHPPTCL